MTGQHYGPGAWANEATQPVPRGGVYSDDPDTERITVADHEYPAAAQPAAAPDWDGQQYEELKARFEETRHRPPIILHSPAEPVRPPWNGFDTFLRRTRDVLVIITCLVLLYTAWRGWVFIGALQDGLKELGDAWGTGAGSLIGTDTPLLPTDCIGEEPC